MDNKKDLEKKPANDMPADGLAPAYSDDHILLLHRYGTDPGRVHADLSWSDTEWFSSVEISIPMVLVDHITTLLSGILSSDQCSSDIQAAHMSP